MYSLHNPQIREIAQGSEQGLQNTIAFVFASIRERTFLLPKYMQEYAKYGSHSSWVWGNKTQGLQYLDANISEIYARMKRIIKSKKASSDVELMLLFLEIPGLGLAKAGFVCQLVAGKSGCIDSHNINRFFPDGKAPAWLSVSKDLSLAKKREKVEKYLDFIRTIGGTRFLWDSWCKHIARQYPKQFTDANHVSKLHLDCIK